MSQSVLAGCPETDGDSGESEGSLRSLSDSDCSGKFTAKERRHIARRKQRLAERLQAAEAAQHVKFPGPLGGGQVAWEKGLLKCPVEYPHQLGQFTAAQMAALWEGGAVKEGDLLLPMQGSIKGPQPGKSTLQLQPNSTGVYLSRTLNDVVSRVWVNVSVVLTADTLLEGLKQPFAVLTQYSTQNFQDAVRGWCSQGPKWRAEGANRYRVWCMADSATSAPTYPDVHNKGHVLTMDQLWEQREHPSNWAARGTYGGRLLSHAAAASTAFPGLTSTCARRIPEGHQGCVTGAEGCSREGRC